VRIIRIIRWFRTPLKSPGEPGNLTSSTRQAGPSGRPSLTNSGTDAGALTCKPTERSKPSSDSRIPRSSSTIMIVGCTVIARAPCNRGTATLRAAASPQPDILKSRARRRKDLGHDSRTPSQIRSRSNSILNQSIIAGSSVLSYLNVCRISLTQIAARSYSRKFQMWRSSAENTNPDLGGRR